MFTRANIVLSVLLGLGAMFLNLALIFALALPFSWLWSWTLVPLMHAPRIVYWQALGLLLIWFILHLIGSANVSAKLRKPIGFDHQGQDL